MHSQAFLRVAAGLFAIGGLTAASACSTATPGTAGKLSIVVGFYPLQFMSERVGGDAVAVTNLAKPGAEPHDLELSPHQVAQIADARVVVYLKGFQPNVDETVAQQAGDRAFDVSAIEPLHDSADPAEQEAADPAGGAASAQDPHFWLDPTRLATVADRLADRLAEQVPDRAADVHARAATLRADLEQLDREYADGLRNCQRHEIVTSHTAFGYLAERYHLEQVGITGLTPEAEPSPRRLGEVATQAREHGATTIFFETLVSAKTAESLAHEVQAQTAVLDPIEGLAAGSGADYLSVMRANLATLEPALGCS